MAASSRKKSSVTPASSTERSPYATALRTASCGELTAADVGRSVILTGWVAHRRDYGKLIFIDLRDRYGMTQVVIDPERTPEAAAAHRDRRRDVGWNTCCASRAWWPSGCPARRIPR